jgi:hypothetical protein
LRFIAKCQLRLSAVKAGIGTPFLSYPARKRA